MNVQRLAGLGAFGAAAGLGLLFALYVWWTVPRAGSGMDLTHALISWISIGGVVLALIAAHLLVGRVLVRDGSQAARGGG